MRSIISIVLIAAALFGSAFIWYRFFTSAPPVPVVGSVSANNNMEVGSKSLLLFLESLEGLKFDLGVIDSPLYKSLQDFTPNILLPTTKGRANPFAPLP
ncbi:MAG: hypothetical protein AAB527_01630 [Patescibacteria group bacterium]